MVGLSDGHAHIRPVRHHSYVDHFADIGHLVEVVQRFVGEDQNGLCGASVSRVLRKELLEEGLGLHGKDTLPLGLLYADVFGQDLLINLAVVSLCMRALPRCSQLVEGEAAFLHQRNAIGQRS